MSKRFTLCAALVFALTLTACGGSATAQSSNTPTDPQTPPSTVQLAGISQFGEDLDGNGVPDRLDAYVANMKPGPETKVAATSYFRLISMLSAKVLAGNPLIESEKQKVFASFQCYYLSAKSESVTQVGLDSEFMKNKRSFDGMHALMSALNGTLVNVAFNKEQMCAESK